jgi:hypothetical protein
VLKVWFSCTENACRSRMAEGLVNHDLYGEVRAFAAGVRPSRLENTIFGNNGGGKEKRVAPEAATLDLPGRRYWI